MTNWKSSVDWRRAFASVVALQLVLAPAVGVAAPANAKVLAVLVASAKKAFDAGEFERAGELFLQVYKQNLTDPVALLNAGRAYQFAGKLERAAAIYAELLAVAGLHVALRSKAEAWQAEIAESQARGMADAASDADKAGRFAVAAQLWGEAYRANSKQTLWKFREARSWHLAGDARQAVAAYDAFLKVAVGGSPEKAEAERHRAALAAASPPPTAKQASSAQPEPAPTAPKPEPAPPVAATPPSATPAQTKEAKAPDAGPAQGMADAAAAADRGGRFALAAQLWSEAARANPKMVLWKFREARSWHRAGEKVQALAAYEEFLKVAPADMPEKLDAEGFRDELRKGAAVNVGGPGTAGGDVAERLAAPVAANAVPQSGPGRPAEGGGATGERPAGTVEAAESKSGLVLRLDGSYTFQAYQNEGSSGTIESPVYGVTTGWRFDRWLVLLHGLYFARDEGYGFGFSLQRSWSTIRLGVGGAFHDRTWVNGEWLGVTGTLAWCPGWFWWPSFAAINVNVGASDKLHPLVGIGMSIGRMRW